MKSSCSAHLFEHIILHSGISDDLGVPEDGCDYFLNVLETFLGKSDVNRESRDAKELMIRVRTELQSETLLHQIGQERVFSLMAEEVAKIFKGLGPVLLLGVGK